ncbi:hypothetical protein AKJ16_DCAP27619, partial [Drosera capensis]
QTQRRATTSHFSHLRRHRTSSRFPFLVHQAAPRASDPKSEADVVETSTSSVQESAFQDDSIYILKLAVGSIIGAGLIKYGSTLFPSIMSPNLVQALLMVSIPMVVAVLLLLQISRKE